MQRLSLPPTDRIRVQLQKTLREAVTEGRTFGVYRRYPPAVWEELVRALAEDPTFGPSGQVDGASAVGALLSPELRNRGLWGGAARAWIKDIVRLCGSVSEVLEIPRLHLAAGSAAQVAPEWARGGSRECLRVICPYTGGGIELLVGSEGPIRRVLHCPPAWVIAECGARFRQHASEGARKHLAVIVTARL